jgi:hypothetical protein
MANVQDWFVLNASPDLRPQIKATLALHPVARKPLRLLSNPEWSIRSKLYYQK